MSTKMSTDLNITRSTTRLHAPPGGQSSISFGESSAMPQYVPGRKQVEGGQSSINFGDSEKKTAVSTSSVAVGVSLEAVTTQLSAISVIPSTHCVSVVIAGTVADHTAVETIVKALYKHHISASDIAITQVADATIIPAISRRIAAEHSFKVILAVAFLAAESIAAESGAALSNLLLSSSFHGSTPIIPAVVRVSSLLELKAILPALADSWAQSVCDLISDVPFVSSEHIAPAPVKTTLASDVISLDQLLEDLRITVAARGAHGIHGFAREFRIADTDGDGKVNFAEFSTFIARVAVNWNAAQVKAAFDQFDGDKSGAVSYDEFLVAMRGRMSSRRNQLVLLAFQILDMDNSGAIEVHEIAARYDASRHPDVLAGKRTSDDVFRDFLGTFGGHEGKVTPDDFIAYYEGVSASIDNDDYFELMIRNAWHISGGEGLAANSSNRRILVNHTDGTQSVEEIKNDIGIKGGDILAMKANLLAQGITDVESVGVVGYSSQDQGPPSSPARVSHSTPTPPPQPPSPTPSASSVGQSLGASMKNSTIFSDMTRPPVAAPVVRHSRHAPGGASSIVLG